MREADAQADEHLQVGAREGTQRERRRAAARADAAGAERASAMGAVGGVAPAGGTARPGDAARVAAMPRPRNTIRPMLPAISSRQTARTPPPSELLSPPQIVNSSRNSPTSPSSIDASTMPSTRSTLPMRAHCRAFARRLR